MRLRLQNMNLFAGLSPGEQESRHRSHVPSVAQISGKVVDFGALCYSPTLQRSKGDQG